MRVEVSFKYMKTSELINNVLGNNFQRLKRHLKMFNHDEAIHVSVHVEKNPHREQYFCRARAYLPHSNVLAVEEKCEDASSAINKGFSALIKRVEKIKEKIENRRKKKGIRHAGISVDLDEQ